MTINFQIPSLAALLGASVLALAPVAASAAETLNWVTYKAKGAGDPQAITTQWFADELERRTDGEYKIRIHWGGSVAGPKEIPTAIENGTGDMGDVITPYFPDLLPINNAISFHVPQPHSSIELGLLMTYWHEVFPAFSEELARYNMIAVGMRPLESYGSQRRRIQGPACAVIRSCPPGGCRGSGRRAGSDEHERHLRRPVTRYHRL